MRTGAAAAGPRSAAAEAPGAAPSPPPAALDSLDPQVADGQGHRDHEPDDDPEHDQPRADRLGHGVETLGREVAGEDEGDSPEPGAEDAERGEGRVAHPAGSRDEWRERPYQADEAADQDRLAAVPGEVVLHLPQPLLRDPDPGAVLDQESPSELRAQHEADRVAAEGGEPGDREDHRQRDVALLSDRPTQYHRELARRDQTHECPGFEEGEPADEQIRPRAEPLREILDQPLEVEAGHLIAEEQEGEDRGRNEATPDPLPADRQPVHEGSGAVASTFGNRSRKADAASAAASALGWRPNAVGPEPVTMAC